MPNQFTNGQGVNLADQTESTKFTVKLKPSHSEKLSELAAAFQMDRSAIFRDCVDFMYERFREFERQYPNHELYSLSLVVKAYYNAAQQRMEDERAKEQAQLEAYWRARELDGGKINYSMDRLALGFYVKAWQSGKSAAEVLEEFAREKARLADRYGIDWHADPWLRNFMQTGTADPEASDSTDRSPTASPTADPDTVTVGLLHYFALWAAIVALTLGLAGSWAWFAFR